MSNGMNTEKAPQNGLTLRKYDRPVMKSGRVYISRQFSVMVLTYRIHSGMAVDSLVCLAVLGRVGTIYNLFWAKGFW